MPAEHNPCRGCKLKLQIRDRGWGPGAVTLTASTASVFVSSHPAPELELVDVTVQCTGTYWGVTRDDGDEFVAWLTRMLITMILPRHKQG